MAIARRPPLTARRRPLVPSPIDPLCRASVLELRDLLVAREVSAREVVDAHIARIEAANAIVNAVVQTPFVRARRAADAVDTARARGEAVPEFAGVPCTVKEHVQVEGLPQTGGLVRRRGAVALTDGVLVERLRGAGFIVVGTTNVPEALTWFETVNRVYGRTNNPWDPSRTPGGSSGGESAIIAAGGSPIGLGGDIGGSIRIPAALAGTVGHKPSGGRLPETGSWPGARGLIARYKVCGPMGRRIADLRAVMGVLAGPDGVDPSVDGPPWNPGPRRDPSTIRVYVYDDNGVPTARATQDVRAGVRRAEDTLRARGFQVERWRPDGLERSFQIWASALQAAGANRFIESLGDGCGVPLAREWLRWPLGRSSHIFPALALATLEQITERFPELGVRIDDEHLALRTQIEAKLGPDGVLVCPPFPRTAPRHGLDAVRSVAGFTYSGVFNPLEFPATAVPVGFGRDGLPLGVQVVGVRMNDALTLDVAEHLEEALGGWRPAPL